MVQILTITRVPYSTKNEASAMSCNGSCGGGNCSTCCYNDDNKGNK